MHALINIGPTIDATIATGAASIATFEETYEDEKHASTDLFDAMLVLGQFRANQELYQQDGMVPLSYPVFDSLVRRCNASVLSPLFLCSNC